MATETGPLGIVSADDPTVVDDLEPMDWIV
jgi:hypothetical protein